MKSIVLDKVEVRENLVQYHYTCSKELEKYFATRTMFIEYEESVENVPLSILTIPFVNCMLGLVWMSDSVLFVDEIDATYYRSISRIKQAYEELHGYPGLKGLFVPSIIKENELTKSNDAILLFGGGIDCQSSFLRNSDRVKYVLNIYGWLNSVEEESMVDVSDKLVTEGFAKQMGITPLHARSNFASQYNLSVIDKSLTSRIGSSYWFAFLHSMAFISITAPLAWIKGNSMIMIASSYTKGRANRHCGSYVTTDSEFYFAENGNVVHDGFELNRQDKVAIIVDYQKSSNNEYNLQVCSFNDHNCCVCEKCFRTILDIIALGGDPSKFGFTDFAKEHWEKVVNRDVALWGVDKESYYYNCSATKMKENYNMILYKDFVDWFLSCDFKAMKNTALVKYYKTNFFSILKRKLHL